MIFVWAEIFHPFLVKVFSDMVFLLTQVTVGENEGVESALRRFKREVVKSGIFNELRRIRHHETPVEKYKRKQRLRNKSRRSGARR